MTSLKEIANKLFAEKSVALICHVRPDGDTVGAAAALKLALKSKGVEAELFCSDVLPARFDFLAEVSSFSDTIKKEYSAIVAVDCAEIFRLGGFVADFTSCKNTYNIDHHVSNNYYAKNNYVCGKASNCENIFELIKNAEVEITADMANLLLTGVVTDTGGFRHKNVEPSTLFVAGELLNKGADLNKISYYMFTMQSKERAKLFGKTMSDLRFFLDGKAAIATVRKSTIDSIGAKPDETEGFIDFVMGIDGVEVGACVMETEKDVYKISLRSKSADVNGVAATFGGGGHTLAAGCKISGAYEEVVDKLRFAISRFVAE